MSFNWYRRVTTAKIELPPKLIPVFSGNYRYRCAYGGRGSGKTRTFALMTAVRAYMAAENGQEGVILCAREFMNSLDDSSMQEIKSAIRSVSWLNNYFDIGEKYIRTKCGRVRYSFAGLRHNVDSLKSKAKILICWIDEAEGVSEVAYSKLLPTVREDGSEVWVTWNPEFDGSPTDTRFRKNVTENAISVEINYSDNPWFPSVLDDERKNDYERLDLATYSWIWEGAYLENSDSQILSGKVEIKEFEITQAELDLYDGAYFGLDFGFAQDPTAAVKCWVRGECLYVEHEAGKVGLELDDTAEFLTQRIPDIGAHYVRADSARPESISYLARHGLPKAIAVKKWAGSIEDGIKHLRQYKKIYIHPRCKELITETRKYSYKVDRLSGDVLPQIVDAHNHYIDALRYALQPLMVNRKSTIKIGRKRRR